MLVMSGIKLVFLRKFINAEPIICLENQFSRILLKTLGVGVKLKGIYIINQISLWLLYLIINGKYRTTVFMHNTLTNNGVIEKYCEDTQYIGNL